MAGKVGILLLLNHTQDAKLASAHSRPGLILFVNHDYFYSIEIFFNQKLFCNRRFLRLKLFLFLFDYFPKLPVIVINLTNKL